jgi:hypothetical protein
VVVQCLIPFLMSFGRELRPYRASTNWDAGMPNLLVDEVYHLAFADTGAETLLIYFALFVRYYLI